ncbi:hypothetical protein M2277_005791, partial [Paenibacillus sp. LBL]|nr:hypothetical protein [Paenibacillus sp. LBL]
KQPVAGSFPPTGCLNLQGVLIPVSQTGVSPEPGLLTL